MRKVQTGFTLIELLITVAIVAILAAVAIPSYSEYVRKARRTEATRTLLGVSAAMEKFLLANNTYPTTIAILVKGDGGTQTGVGSTGLTEDEDDASKFNSENGNYTVSRDDASETATTGWVLLASAASTVAQTDEDCYNFRITQTGVKSATQKSGAAATAECWAN